MIIAALLAALCLSSCSDISGISLPKSEQDIGSRSVELGEITSEIRGVWIASVFNIDFPSRTDLDAWKLRDEIDDILDNCEMYGLNTIFFQVRPSCDALYESKLFPVSKNLSSTGRLTIDPLEYMVSQAHLRGISVHAWVNPLRVTVTRDSESSLPAESPAVLHPEWTVKYADGKLYFNAGLPEVRDFISEGVKEIVEGYDVDGVVFDDYFYPYPTDGAQFDDSDSYAEYGSDYENIGDWRRDNINRLIQSCSAAVKSADPSCLFGVSPGGVWQNDNGTNDGSPSAGFETYTSLYCDSIAWIRGGYIDYISPQLYWQCSSNATPFGELVKWWNRMLDGSGVELVVSHAAYRYEEGDWSDPYGEMERQITLSRELLSYRGSMFYGYDELASNARGIADEISSAMSYDIYYFDSEATGTGVTFTSHYDGEICAVGEVTVSGYSDPAFVLEFDGRTVGRYSGGRFEISTVLSKGENSIVLMQDGKEYTITLYAE